MGNDAKMMVGTLRLRLIIRGARSLKDKRRSVKSFKDRVRNRFNASVAEVEALEAYQTAVLGVAVVGNDTDYVKSVLAKIVRLAAGTRDAELIDCKMEMR